MPINIEELKQKADTLRTMFASDAANFLIGKEIVQQEEDADEAANILLFALAINFLSK